MKVSLMASLDINCLPEDKIVDWVKLKAIADDRCYSKHEICFG